MNTDHAQAACTHRRVHVTVALLWGAVCHASFAVAITAMYVGVRGGLELGIGNLHGARAAVANATLVLQFPLIHSFLLTATGRRALARLAPGGLGRPLGPTTFAAISSWQVLTTFLLWSPSGVVWWHPQGAALWLTNIVYAASWVFLVRAIHDAGAGTQTGFIGWSSVVRRRQLDFGPFPTHGLFRACRQPVYLAFAATLWTAPVRTPDGLWLALAWGAYCFLGPLHKERRYLARFGEAYASYQRSTPYMLPRTNT